MKNKTTTFDIVNYIMLSLLCVITIYPVLYVLFASFSDPLLLEHHSGLMLSPQGFSLEGYSAVLESPNIALGYRNTIFYVLVGTSINMVMTIFGAYAISRKDLYIRKPVTILIIITMQFSGGLIPTYVVVENILGSSMWTQLIPGAIVATNLLIMRTGFMAIPDSLLESARIDGANDWTILQKIILPLSKPTLAVIGLYYGVSHWNRWLPATIYLRDRQLFPLQLFLREILIQSQIDETVIDNPNLITDLSEVIKYSTIMVAIIPVLCVYPFLQKFFVKGVMLGAVKG